MPPAPENRSTTGHASDNRPPPAVKTRRFRCPVRGAEPRRSRAALARGHPVVEEEVKQPIDDADDNGAPQGRPEAGDVERQRQLAGYPAAQPQQERIDHEPEEAEREYVEEAADGLHYRLDDRVHDAKDQGDGDKRAD